MVISREMTKQEHSAAHHNEFVKAKDHPDAALREAKSYQILLSRYATIRSLYSKQSQFDCHVIVEMGVEW
jgi:hypothetical protein